MRTYKYAIQLRNVKRYGIYTQKPLISEVHCSQLLPCTWRLKKKHASMSGSVRPAVVCLAYGEVTGRASDRRNLHNSSSRHVVPLWKNIIVAEELSKRNQHADFDGLIAGHSCYICRKCFCAYEKCLKLTGILALKASEALDVVLPSTSTCCTTPIQKRQSSTIIPPPAKRCT